MDDALKRIRAVADYQFGKGVGLALFPENVEVRYSRATGRIRYVYLDGDRLATLRPTDGFFSLSIKGAKRIVESGGSPKCFVTIKNSVSEFVAEGGDAFAVHVAKADDEIRPKDEVIALDQKGKVLAVGRATLSGEEMKAFKVGVAIKVRHGCLKEG